MFKPTVMGNGLETRAERLRRYLLDMLFFFVMALCLAQALTVVLYDMADIATCAGVTLAACLAAAIIFFNGTVTLVSCMLLAIGVFFVVLFPERFSELLRFLAGAKENMIYVNADFHALYTPIAAMLVTLIAVLILYIFTFKLSAPLLSGAVGTIAFMIFYYYTRVYQYTQADSGFILVLFCIFFLSFLYFALRATGRKQPQKHPGRTAAAALIPYIAAVSACVMLFSSLAPKAGAFSKMSLAMAELIRKHDYIVPQEAASKLHVSGIGEQDRVELSGELLLRDSLAFMLETDYRGRLYLRTNCYVRYNGHGWENEYNSIRWQSVDTSGGDLRGTYLFRQPDRWSGEEKFSARVYAVSGMVRMPLPLYTASVSVDERIALGVSSLGTAVANKRMDRQSEYRFTFLKIPEDQENLQSGDSGGLNEEEYKQYTELLAWPSMRLRELAENLKRGNDRETIEEIRSYIQKNVRYTTTPSPISRNAEFVDALLFGTREGYCTSFATAMVVLARMNGIPARYVEGYSVLGGGVSAQAVSELNAHAWAEIYLPGFGWTVCDAVSGDDLQQPVAPSQQPAPSATPTVQPDVSPTATQTVAPVTTSPKASPSVSAQGTQLSEQLGDTQTFFGAAMWALGSAVVLLVGILCICVGVKYRQYRRITARRKEGMSRQEQCEVFNELMRALHALGFAPANGQTVREFLGGLIPQTARWCCISAEEAQSLLLGAEDAVERAVYAADTAEQEKAAQLLALYDGVHRAVRRRKTLPVFVFWWKEGVRGEKRS